MKKIKWAWWINLSFLILVTLFVIAANALENHWAAFLPGFFIAAYYLFSTKSILKSGIIRVQPLNIIQKISGYIMGFQGLIFMIGSVAIFLFYCYQIRYGTTELILSNYILMYVSSLIMFIFGFSLYFYSRKSMGIFNTGQKPFD